MSVFALHGRIGSGKDTVKNIVVMSLQGYSPEEICNHLSSPGSLVPQIALEKSPFSERRFAGPIKEFISMISGIPLDVLNDNEFKDKYHIEELDNMKMRDFMIKIGDGLRSAVHTGIYAFAAKMKYLTEKKKGLDPLWIMPDLRLLPEYDFLVEDTQDPLIIRVFRPEKFKIQPGFFSKEECSDTEYWTYGFEGRYVLYGSKYPDYSEGLPAHSKIDISHTTLNQAESENGLNMLHDDGFDMTIYNTGSLKDLVDCVVEDVVPIVETFIDIHEESIKLRAV